MIRIRSNIVQSCRLYSTATTTTSTTTTTPKLTSFNDIYNDLSTRFLRDTLNTTNRNLAFRPRRAKELTSRKNPIIVNGVQLEPLQYKGRPGKGELFRLLSSVSTIDEYQKSKTILQNYAKYNRESLQSLHLAHFIRAAANVGQLNDAFRTISIHKLFTKKIINKRTGVEKIVDTFVDEVVYKELFRLRVISSGLANRPSAYFNQIYKTSSKLDNSKIDNSLLLTTGLINSLQRSIEVGDEKSTGVFEKRLSTRLEKLKEQVDSLSTEPYIKQAEDKTLTNSVRFPFVIDLTLGVEALEKLAKGEITSNEELITLGKSIAINKPQEIIPAWNKTFSNEYVPNYIKSVQEGYKTGLLTNEEVKEDNE